jgi:hypothetical protein
VSDEDAAVLNAREVEDRRFMIKPRTAVRGLLHEEEAKLFS